MYTVMEGIVWLSKLIAHGLTELAHPIPAAGGRCAASLLLQILHVYSQSCQLILHNGMPSLN